MRNDDGDQDYPESPLARRCGQCGDLLLTQRKGSKYCDRKCKELARAARKRAGDRLTTLRGKYPLPDEAFLREHADVYDAGQDGDGQDDEAGIHAFPGQGDVYDPDVAWSERMQLTTAVDAVQARYEPLLSPYRETMRRNPGVKPAAMARLEHERDSRIRALHRQADRAEALARAARHAPVRAVQAAERQQSEAALTAFGRELRGGSRRYEAPAWSGRHTDDLAAW
jgi:hypothetical protein